MKKRFWTRLVSAVVTMAIAFSILAMPASAASEEQWGLCAGSAQAPGGDTAYGWISKSVLKDQIYEKWDDSFADTFGEYTDEKLNLVLDLTKSELGKGGVTICEKVPEGAYTGLSQTEFSTSEILWFNKDDSETIRNFEDEGYLGQINWEEGTIEIAGDIFYAIGYEPALATEEDLRWTMVMPLEKIPETVFDIDMQGYIWVPAKAAFKEQTVITKDDVKNAKLGVLVLGGEVKDIDVDEQVYMGISETTEEDNVYWYTESEITKFDTELEKANVTNPTYSLTSDGKFVAKDSDGKVIATATPIDYKTPTPAPSTPSASGGGASGDGAGLAIAAAGAAAVAATGIYFYTHPEKVQEIKDWFADLKANIQQKMDTLTGNVRGLFGADNAAEQAAPEARTNSEAPAVPVVPAA